MSEGINFPTLQLAKSYTDKTIEGIVGPIVGKNCTIKEITKEGKQNKVTFQWTSDSGESKEDYMYVLDGADGEDGKDGVQRVRLTADDNHIYDSDHNILTFLQVKELVMDSSKFVTLTIFDNISFLPSAYNETAIWFDAGFIEEGTPNQLRVIINDQNKVNIDQIELAEKAALVALQTFCKVSEASDNALQQKEDGLYVKKSESGEPYDDTEVRELIAENAADITSLGGRVTNTESDIGSVESDISDLELAMQDLTDSKVDKVEGKGLSTNDLTNELKEKYDKAEENVQSDWNEKNDTSDAYIKNKPNLDDFVKVQSISVDGEKITPDQDKNVDIDLSGKVDKEENKSLISITDISQITINKNAITLLNDNDEVDGSVRNIVKRAVEGSMHLSKQFIDHKPTVEEAKENILYLVPIDDDGTCEQYVLAENKVVMIGSTKVDLSNYYNKQEVDDIVDEIQLYKFPNAIIYGQPTINNGQISGFSSDNYLGLPFVFDTKDRGFEINVAFTTNSDVITAQNIFGSKFCIALYVQNGQLVFRAGDGSDWSVADITTTLSVQANTTYYVKIAFNKLNYTISYSTNGEDYESIGSKVTTIPPTVGQVNIGIGNNQHNPFNGIINLNKTFITLNNTVVWEGMDDVGLATRLATDLENIDSDGVAKIKEIVGEDFVQKDGDKVLSDNNYTNDDKAEVDKVKDKADLSVVESSQGKNIIPYPYYNQDLSYRGIEYTVNDDGSVNCNGTASGGVANFVFFDNRASGEPNLIKKDIEYTLSSTNQIPTRVNVAIRTYDSSKAILEQFTVTNNLNNVKVKFTKDFAYSTIYIAIGDSVTVDNLVVYPMLEKGSVAHSYEPTVESNVSIIKQEKLTQGRNLITYPYYAPSGVVNNGITYTINNDGSITANGTASANADSYFNVSARASSNWYLKAGQYTLSGNPSQDNNKIRLVIGGNSSTGSGETIAIDYGKGVTFEITEESAQRTKQVILFIARGETVNNLTFYPMLEEGTIAHEYEPTVESNVSLKKSVDNKSLNILWSNPSPNTNFASQSITLNNSNYDYLIFQYKYRSGANYIVGSLLVTKGNGLILSYASNIADNTPVNYNRVVDYVDDTHYSFGNASAQRTNATTVATDNQWLIPLAIYGAKF